MSILEIRKLIFLFGFENEELDPWNLWQLNSEPDYTNAQSATLFYIGTISDPTHVGVEVFVDPVFAIFVHTKTTIDPQQFLYTLYDLLSICIVILSYFLV